MITSFKMFESNDDIDIDEIFNSYLTTAIWTDEESLPETVDKSVDSISEDSNDEAKNEIIWFVNTAIKLKPDIFDNIFAEGGSNERVGSDIWFTRNSHGTGFWDRGYDDDDAKILTELSKVLGEANIYANDDEINIETYKNYKKFNLQEYLINRSAKKFNI